MSKYTFITSMSKDYYDTVGYKMLETFTKFLPNNIVIYSEDELPIPKQDISKNIKLNNFLADLGETRAKGFAYKAYSIIESLKKNNTKYFVYLDADMICFRHISEDFLDNLIKNNFITYVGVTHHTYGSHCDSCFFIIDTENSYFDNFIQEYEDVYESRKILNKDLFVKPNDSYVLAHCIRLAEQNNIPCNDLHKERKSLSPIAESILGTYIRHFKASRKINSGVLQHVDKAINAIAKKKDPAKILERFDRRVRQKK